VTSLLVRAYRSKLRRRTASQPSNHLGTIQPADCDMLGAPVWVRPFDQDFSRREVEMTVRQMQGETRQFPVTGQDVPDFLQAVQIAVVERRCLVQLRQVRLLHRAD
jgi:hypothetical protein